MCFRYPFCYLTPVMGCGCHESVYSFLALENYKVVEAFALCQAAVIHEAQAYPCDLQYSGCRNKLCVPCNRKRGN
jgi:hypothetical protein